MVVIDKINNGSFIISLRDKINLYIDDDFDFKFINDMTKEELNYTFTDVSIHPNRYSEFPYQSILFQNSTTGFWTYYVEYHGTLIASGKMILQSNNVPDIKQYDGYDGTRIVYEK